MDAEVTVDSLGLPFHFAAQLRLTHFFVTISLEHFFWKLKCELKTDKWWGINCWSLMTPAAVPELSFKVLKCEISATGHHSCCYFTMTKKKAFYISFFYCGIANFFFFFEQKDVNYCWQGILNKWQALLVRQNNNKTSTTTPEHLRTRGGNND